MTTSYVVLDSGILLATVQTETFTKRAKALLAYFNEHNFQLAAPTLIKYEIAAVTRKWVYRELATADKADAALKTLLEVPIKLFFDQKLLQRGYALAAELNRPTAYDSQYLAVAEHLECEFWTIDERFFNAVHEQFPGIKWIGNWKPESE